MHITGEQFCWNHPALLQDRSHEAMFQVPPMLSQHSGDDPRIKLCTS
jgi:hypothetical protein